MSTEPDYNFNEPATTESSSMSLSLPFSLIAAALAVFMAAQTHNSFFTRRNLIEGKEQLIQGKQQLVELQNGRKKLEEDSQKLQKQLQDLVLDLMLLAKTDQDAQAIVTKFNIQNNPTPGAPGGESPAPAPAPAP